MPEDFVRIRLATCNCYAYRGASGWLLVDTGGFTKASDVLGRLRRARVDPAEIKLVIISHVHFDHIRGLRAIVAASGADVLCHRAEASFLRLGRNTPSAGRSLFGKIVLAVAWKLAPLLQIVPFSPQISIDQPFSLASTGFSVRVLPTPGHTVGSITAIADEKYAFVGDLLVNTSNKCRDNFMPAFAENVTELFQSWQTVLDSGVTTICPAHGRPFAAPRLQAFLDAKTGEMAQKTRKLPESPPK